MWNFRFPFHFPMIQPDVYFGTHTKTEPQTAGQTLKFGIFGRWLNFKWNEFSVDIHRVSGGFIGCCWIVKVCHYDKNERMQSVRLSACTSTTKHSISSLMLTTHSKRVNYCDAVSCRLTLFISRSGNSNIPVYRLKFYYMKFIIVMVVWFMHSFAGWPLLWFRINHEREHFRSICNTIHSHTQNTTFSTLSFETNDWLSE